MNVKAAISGTAALGVLIVTLGLAYGFALATEFRTGRFRDWVERVLGLTSGTRNVNAAQVVQ